MKITTLVENRSSRSDPQLEGEWGLSLHIQANGRGILFDTGASGLFARNAARLSVELASVDAAVLSHHHYDHGGGLRRFLELNSKARVHLGEAPRGDCFFNALVFMKKYVGLDKSLLTNYPDRFVTVSEPAEVLPGVFVFPHIRGTRPRPAGNRYLYLKRGGDRVLDDFDHEVVMVVKEDGKLVVFTGCSHNGLLNMVDRVAAAFPGTPVKAVVGGFHLVTLPLFNFMGGSKGEIESLAGEVLGYPVEVTWSGHCTGTKAFQVMESVMGDRLRDLRTGSVFEV